MEKMELSSLFGGIYAGKKVLVTGHTGFKGSWLIYWLKRMGAQVYGLALEPDTQPDHLSLLEFDHQSFIHDINDHDGLVEIIRSIQPDIVFHLAAQALVRRSYQQPAETFHTNVVGTANVMDACRACASLKAIVIVTTDKCYDNKEWIWPYRENDSLGGKDPYSASKACAEILVSAYRHSYFHPAHYKQAHQVLIATARAGNVIGGGDWADDRIIPDLVRASASGSVLNIRFPHATRPWQHVLEPLSGYLMLGWKLLMGEIAMAEPWNFGPDPESNLPVLDLVHAAVKLWPLVAYEIEAGQQPHEAGLLMLDSAKAKASLGWHNVWDFQDTLKHTITWYRNYYETGQVDTDANLLDYVQSAREKKLKWTLL